ncbi:BppU family phage baseplate upper protein [candidate division WOR-3 bacterium]|nr:BppU family phage baseplate upper protein [candidate division WOR-3 bacterium]
MSDTDTIQITQNDKGFKLNFTVKDSDGNIVVLTDMSIELQVAEKVTFTEKFKGACAIVSETAGTCSYEVQATNFNEVKNYYGILQLTKNEEVVSTRRFDIEIVKELA